MFSFEIMSCNFAVISSLRLVALSQILHFGATDLNVAIKSTLQGYSNTFLSNLEDSSPFLTRIQLSSRGLQQKSYIAVRLLQMNAAPPWPFIPSLLDLHAPFLPPQGSPSC